VLRKDLLRVSRAGGGYRPRFVGRERRPLAAKVLGAFEATVGEPRSAVTAAVDTLEAESEDFKLVRGLAALVERECVFEARSTVPPPRVRRAAFEAAEAVGVAGADDRARAIDRAADRLGVDAAVVETDLYADRERNEVLVDADVRWDPDALIEQYNLSLAQTALFDATEVRVRSVDPKALVSAVKRLRLMYELRRTDDGRELVVTGPDALFRRTRRYGTAFARLLRTVAGTAEWRLEATIDDRGTERTMTLTEADVTVPGVDPVAEPDFDSGVEADFAGRVRGLDLDWTLVREPEPLATGTRAMIPDFAFEYDHADFTLYFEVMGFWTPEYVEKKLDQLAGLEDVDLLVAADESLGVGEAIAARDHRVLTYTGTVRVKAVVDVLREHEADLVAEAAADLPASFAPDEDVLGLDALAARHGVSESAVEDGPFPDHELVGRTLIRPAVLERLREEIADGTSLSAVEKRLDASGIDDASATLSALGYRVEWEGLSGGTVRPKDGSPDDA
jgi:predicted nuclease of restriction endonuclease-like RecB superfamily